MLNKRWQDKAMRLMLTACASTSILVVALIFIFLGKESVPFAREPGLSALWDHNWIPVSFQKERFGLLPLATGSLMVTLLAMLMAGPLGVLGAVYISEIARPWEREILKPFIEILAGIPSVVLGFFGLVVIGPLVKDVFHLSSGLTALTGAILLALMAIPTIISVSEDAIHAVPAAYKQASMALGASHVQTMWRVTVPAATPGILAATLLGMGRVIGETMAVMMVTGNAAIVTFSPLQSVRTMTATIAAEMGEVALGGTHYGALFCVGLILLLVTFGLNHLAQTILRRYENRR
ncbi:MAG TPA: phosphate ABC transporter permease subunit PstC [Phycisphaerae bacterium]|nr:phosphate ABC transporter permease subunit PstC [Phycisphaerae bacterium]